jgi:hypothetical protein
MIDPCDERPSELQEDWQDKARRIRMQIERTLQAIEKEVAQAPDDTGIRAEVLQHLATAALSAFALERQASSMDANVRRDQGAW